MTDSYYGQPVIKPPVWTWEIPAYFFTGGVAGVSSMVAAGARLVGDRELADRARAVAAGAAALSPALLTSDLGRPDRFHHMLRVFRPSSPMNLGSWLLTGYVPAALGSWLLGRDGRTGMLQRLAESVAGLLGPAIATYTSVLVADTAVPVWHEARRELPFLFAASSLSGAGSTLLLVDRDGTPAGRMAAMAGTATEIAIAKGMETRLGELGEVYRNGTAGRLSRAARLAAGAGLALTALARGKGVRRLGAGLMLAGSVCERWAVFRAGFQSAEDPAYTVGPQRRRVESQPAPHRPAESPTPRRKPVPVP